MLIEKSVPPLAIVFTYAPVCESKVVQVTSSEDPSTEKLSMVALVLSSAILREDKFSLLGISILSHVPSTVPELRLKLEVPVKVPLLL